MFNVVLPDGYGFDFPVWVTVHGKRLAEVGLPRAYMGLTLKQHGPVFMVFTSGDLAQELVSRQPAEMGLAVHALTGISELRKLAEEVAAGGCTKVVFDASGRPGVKSRAYDLPAFASFLGALDRR
jgi:hypothetical protein